MIHTDKDKAELICRISNVDTKKCMKCGKCSASCQPVTVWISRHISSFPTHEPWN